MFRSFSQCLKWSLPFAACSNSDTTNRDEADDIWTSEGFAVSKDIGWLGEGNAHVLRLPGEAEENSGSVLVLDGKRDFHSYSSAIHKFSLSHATASSITPVRYVDEDVDPEAPVDSYSLPFKESWVQGFLDRFVNDAPVMDALRREFGIDGSECSIGRAEDLELLLVLRHASMAPSDFHTDICVKLMEFEDEDSDIDLDSLVGITVLTYPADHWDPRWQGHFELGSKESGVHARIAPLPNRSIIFNGCLHHRATNPSAFAAPLKRQKSITQSLSRSLGVGKKTFAVALQTTLRFSGLAL